MSLAEIAPVSLAADRNLARSLGAWQVMDMVLVDRQGHMAVGSVRPVGQTGRLLDLDILRRERRGEGWVLIKGQRFDRIKFALQSIAEARQRTEEWG